MDLVVQVAQVSSAAFGLFTEEEPSLSSTEEDRVAPQPPLQSKQDEAKHGVKLAWSESMQVNPLQSQKRLEASP